MNVSSGFDEAYKVKGMFGYMHSDVAPEVILRPKADILSFIPDNVLTLALPVVAYWALSLIFHSIDVLHLAEKYRIHPSAEVAARNRVGRIEVLCEVLFQHIVQSVVGFVTQIWDTPPMTGYEERALWKWRQYLPSSIPDAAIYVGYMYGFSAVKLLVGFTFIDTWQYWLHRLMHTNSTLYRMFHSRHHRLYVPYAYGALYNAPVEGFLLDTLGTGIAMIITSLSYREQMVLYTFATLKTVDDHCGYALPWDPFQFFFPNNAVYHDIHHQNFGIKTNYAQPFFTFWDTLFGTYFKGFEDYQKAQRRVTIDQYKKFLDERKKKSQPGKTE
ncbi:hypothetical protein HG535_0A04250 [Zygotorulaspora mrakii]|uniref:Fatty acid hydroxylase domain-containing protein n=1 Tax=Zygotorulaspora mrakii TaxID=42260 RepID=A0A7H9AVZ6_ZYGMR|nr:uncharacterized protein HG535_0A04250 [Zygotorulaspora mrakii]QLG70485.1 hypothetical protein HG535_0A04250 [Zygotorulaspora mrakii]